MEVFFFTDTDNCLRRRGQSLTPSLFFEIRAVARFKSKPEVRREIEKRLQLLRDRVRERQAARGAIRHRFQSSQALRRSGRARSAASRASLRSSIRAAARFSRESVLPSFSFCRVSSAGARHHNPWDSGEGFPLHSGVFLFHFFEVLAVTALKPEPEPLINR